MTKKTNIPLSGTGTDGTKGALTLKGKGATVIAESEATARLTAPSSAHEMQRTALEVEQIDLVLREVGVHARNHHPGGRRPVPSRRTRPGRREGRPADPRPKPQRVTP